MPIDQIKLAARALKVERDAAAIGSAVEEVWRYPDVLTPQIRLLLGSGRSHQARLWVLSCLPHTETERSRWLAGEQPSPKQLVGLALAIALFAIRSKLERSISALGIRPNPSPSMTPRR
jgi:hypothetical protein